MPNQALPTDLQTKLTIETVEVDGAKVQRYSSGQAVFVGDSIVMPTGSVLTVGAAGAEGYGGKWTAGTEIRFNPRVFFDSNDTSPIPQVYVNAWTEFGILTNRVNGLSRTWSTAKEAFNQTRSGVAAFLVSRYNVWEPMISAWLS